MAEPTLTVKQHGRDWAVFAGQDRVSQPYMRPAQAWAQRTRLLNRPALEPRACLCCDAVFPSEGKHNRLCPRCTKAAADMA